MWSTEDLVRAIGLSDLAITLDGNRSTDSPVASYIPEHLLQEFFANHVRHSFLSRSSVWDVNSAMVLIPSYQGIVWWIPSQQSTKCTSTQPPRTIIISYRANSSQYAQSSLDWAPLPGEANPHPEALVWPCQSVDNTQQRADKSEWSHVLFSIGRGGICVRSYWEPLTRSGSHESGRGNGMVPGISLHHFLPAAPHPAAWKLPSLYYHLVHLNS